MTAEELNLLRPGSKEACEHGCSCPVLDNRHGEGIPLGNGGKAFYMNAECKLHGDQWRGLTAQGETK